MRETAPQLSESERASALFRQAEACRRAHDLAAAEELYTKALLLAPDLRLAYLHRGRIRVLQHQADPAVEDLTSALRLHGNDAVAHWWRGDAHAVAGRYAAALADYTRARELRPDLVPVRYNRAVALRKCGDLDQALAELDQLVRLKPEYGPLYLNRGLIWLERGNLARAAEEFRIASRHHPDSQEARQRLHETEALLQQHAEEVSGGRTSASTTPPPPCPDLATVPMLPPETAIDQVPAPPLQAPAPGPPALPAGPAAGSSRPPFSCPGCGRAASVRWKKVRGERVLKCGQCRRKFTAKPGGLLVEAAKTPKRSPGPRRPRHARKKTAKPAPADAPSSAALLGDDEAPKPVLASETVVDRVPSVPPLPTPAGTAADQADAARKSPARSSSRAGNLVVPCPGCGKTSSVGWDKLQRGKVLGCRQCGRTFTMYPDGRLIEVVRARNGSWVDRERKETQARLARSKRFKVLGTFATVGLLAWAVSQAPKLVPGSSPTEAPLPVELEPRAEVFARAWLKGDTGTMRRLTDPTQDRQLFPWSRRNPPPPPGDSEPQEEDVKVVVETLPSKPGAALLRIRFEGLPPARGGAPVELRLGWEERGGTWLFQPGSTPSRARTGT